MNLASESRLVRGANGQLKKIEHDTTTLNKGSIPLEMHRDPDTQQPLAHMHDQFGRTALFVAGLLGRGRVGISGFSAHSQTSVSSPESMPQCV